MNPKNLDIMIKWTHIFSEYLFRMAEKYPKKDKRFLEEVAKQLSGTNLDLIVFEQEHKEKA